jgi:hypothetical protein
LNGKVINVVCGGSGTKISAAGPNDDSSLKARCLFEDIQVNLSDSETEFFGSTGYFLTNFDL